MKEEHSLTQYCRVTKKHIQHQTDEISIVSLVKCSQSIGGVEAMPDIPGQAQEQNKQLRCGKGVF